MKNEELYLNINATERTISDDKINGFKRWLADEEKSANTIEKYARDVSAFAKFSKSVCVCKEIVIKYKSKLISDNYSLPSINSMLAGINSFFEYTGWKDCKVKPLKNQNRIYCSEDRELSKAEYMQLVHTARKKGNERLYLLIQTICSTGIRVSELPYITASAARCGKATVTLKGKTRTVIITKALQKELLRYVSKHRISNGSIFVTKSGAPMNRSNIWREMKQLCADSKINPNKVFPHNLRHLFARVFYEIEKDLVKLADILGHSNINTTRIYTSTSESEHRQKIERMNLIKKGSYKRAFIT